MDAKSLVSRRLRHADGMGCRRLYAGADPANSSREPPPGEDEPPVATDLPATKGQPAVTPTDLAIANDEPDERDVLVATKMGPPEAPEAERVETLTVGQPFLSSLGAFTRLKRCEEAHFPLPDGQSVYVTLTVYERVSRRNVFHYAVVDAHDIVEAHEVACGPADIGREVEVHKTSAQRALIPIPAKHPLPKGAGRSDRRHALGPPRRGSGDRRRWRLARSHGSRGLCGRIWTQLVSVFGSVLRGARLHVRSARHRVGVRGPQGFRRPVAGDGARFEPLAFTDHGPKGRCGAPPRYRNRGRDDRPRKRRGLVFSGWDRKTSAATSRP